MVYWCFTALPKALWQLCLWFMPVSLQYPTLGKNLEKPWKNLQKPRKTKKPWKKPAETKKTLEKPWKNLQKPWKTKKNGKKQKKQSIYIYIHISRLFGGGPCQDSLKIVFLVFVFCFFFGFPRFFFIFLVFQGFCRFFQCFFGFGHFQPFAPFCTLAVRCFHAFKLARTNRLTTAAMNILGLRIKTVRSNFEMFGHVLDNNLSFMLFFQKMLHKLIAHFDEVIRPFSQALLYCITMESAVDSCYTFLEGCYTDLPGNYSLLKIDIHTQADQEIEYEKKLAHR